MGRSIPAALVVLACAGGAPPVAEVPPRLDNDLVQRGGLLFMNPGLSADGTRSCTTCHPGGRADDRVWIEGREAAPGEPGARRTRSLRGAWRSAPYFWDASAPTLEAAIERMLRVEMGGARLGPRDLEALVAYVSSLTPFDRGRVEPDGTPVEPVILSARRGWDEFRRARCGLCHVPPSFQGPIPADVGSGGAIDVPSLRGLADRAPYGHDGRWKTVEDALLAKLAALGLKLDFDQRLRLLEYLKLL